MTGFGSHSHFWCLLKVTQQTEKVCERLSIPLMRQSWKWESRIAFLYSGIIRVYQWNDGTDTLNTWTLSELIKPQGGVQTGERQPTCEMRHSKLVCWSILKILKLRNSLHDGKTLRFSYASRYKPRLKLTPTPSALKRRRIKGGDSNHSWKMAPTAWLICFSALISGRSLRFQYD